MKSKLLTLVVFIIVASMALAGPLQASPRYFYQDLSTLGGNGSTEAKGINNAGQVVGMSINVNGRPRAFLKNPDQPMQDLGTLGGYSSVAYNINNAGQIVGAADNKGGQSCAFLKNPDQPMENLGGLEGSSSVAYGINDSAQVVGYAAPQNHPRAFLKNPGEPMQNLGTLGGDQSMAFSINNAGQVVGLACDAGGHQCAFLKNPGEPMQDLGNLGRYPSTAYSINNAGQVVGFSYAAEYGLPCRAFLKNPGQTMQALGYIEGHAITAWCINNVAQIVGYSRYYDADNKVFKSRALLWEKGTMYDLNNLTVNLPTDIVLGDARAINDNGWIVGISDTIPSRAFLLTPAPLPVRPLSFLGLLLN